MKRASLLALILSLALISLACPKRTNISRIEADPAKYLDKEVAIAGTVTNSFGIPLIGGVYKVDDGTGQMWVATERSTPSKGARIGVKGRIQQGLTVAGKNYGLGMVETDRRIK
jgi:hypothetical protein